MFKRHKESNYPFHMLGKSDMHAYISWSIPEKDFSAISFFRKKCSHCEAFILYFAKLSKDGLSSKNYLLLSTLFVRTFEDWRHVYVVLHPYKFNDKNTAVFVLSTRKTVFYQIKRATLLLKVRNISLFLSNTRS